jgi:phosphopantothenoylcysteine synthetase/decarboxylase
VLQRTFNLNIMARATAGGEPQEFELSMIDQADFSSIDAYIKTHGLQDASLAEERRAKRYNINGKTEEAAAGANGDGTAEEESELQKAQRELEDQEDEEEEDYDPGSDGDSDGSGSSSDDDDDDDDDEHQDDEDDMDEDEDGEQDLVAAELGSQAADIPEDQV